MSHGRRDQFEGNQDSQIIIKLSCSWYLFTLGSRVLSLTGSASRKWKGRFSRAVEIRSPTLTREILVEGELAANSTSDNIDIDHGHQSQ
jgi:hypothetical protein